MGKLQEFLLNENSVDAAAMEVEIAPFPFPFLVKSITEGENKAIKKSCQKITFDKKSRQKQTETDQDLYNNRLIIACTKEPNFKDAALQEKYGVRGAEALIDTLLNPGQFTNLLLAILEINGFDDDINDLVDEAKNLSPAETMPPEPTAKRTMPTMPYSG